MTQYEILTKFWQEFKNIIEKHKLKEIYVNVYIGCALQDSYDFLFEKGKEYTKTDESYLIGKFNLANILVNPNMKYSDLRIMNEKGDIFHDFSEEYKGITLI